MANSDFDSNSEAPRKVNPDTIQVIGTHGEVVQNAKKDKKANQYQETPFGKIRVFQPGPWALLLIPILIPVAIFAVFFLGVLALFFGRSVFKIASRGVRKS